MKTKSCNSDATRSRKLQLNNTAVKGVAPGQTLWDTEVPGLHVQRKTDTAYYLYFRTRTRRARRPKIGDVRAVTLAQARAIARDMLYQVAAGKDPMAEREAVIDSPTVDALFERVFREHWRKAKTREEIKRRYYAHVRGHQLGKLRVLEVQYDDIVAVRERMEGTPYQANRVLTDLAKMFNYAERPLKWRERHTNPCSGVVPYPELKRKKFFRAEHLQRLLPVLAAWLATEGEDRIARARRRSAAYLTFQLYTGARPEEPESITPEMIDGAVARLNDSKEGQRDIYIPAQAMAALRSQPWVKGRPILGRFPKKLWPRIRQEAGCEDLWARDTRRTFGCAVLSTAHGAQAGELLGHQTAQTTKRYVDLLEDSAHEAAAAGAARIDDLAKRPMPIG